VLVANAEKAIIGGIALLYQGNAVRYFKGAADPHVRNLPVLHLALWEGIKSAAQDGFKQFDFWGYNHHATESDQIFFINRFKKGFGGTFTSYPKKMYFIFKPVRYKLIKTMKNVYHRFFNS
jgi:lipid II:glycine glycyltransferase (peptidoglycan interpeptide bridge formation enzyme)